MSQKKKYTNRLVNEKSPYLLQHAHNPVDWYPWCEEAFQKAKKEDKPIFLSIGYSTCHWCHVMERESFEDEEVAKLLNEFYVSIKVDREERPDIDQLYMTVCQAMTGQGGWPLTIIMTPDKKPFYAGTYIPKEDQYDRTGLLKLLPKVADLWKKERERAEKMSNRVVEFIKGHLEASDQAELDATVFDFAFEQYARQFDEIYGGFGAAPKFPRPHDLLFLLRYWKEKNDNEALEMVELTLRSMRKGGIYDHLGYGFSRYSVDREWLVPHFEKMLYDNALLAYTYTEAYQATRDEFYRQVVEEILSYVLRDMTSEEGGFFSAEDADSEGEEGKFYVWTPQQIKDALGEDDGELFCECYDVTSDGNFEKQTSILNQIHVSFETIARKYGMTEKELEEKLAKFREKLFEVRKQRVHPYKDDKILTAWNGLMIAALSRAGRVLQNQTYLKAAIEAARFIEEKLVQDDGRLLARYRDGEAAYLGYLDDYAFYVWGLIELYEATWNSEYLEKAMKQTKVMIDLFWDQQNDGFFFYGSDSEQLLIRPKEIYDGAMPSGNAVAALNLLRLAAFTMDESIKSIADRQLKAFASSVQEQPTSHSFMLVAMQFALGKRQEIVITGNPNDPLTQAMIEEVQRAYCPNAILALRPQGEGSEALKDLFPTVDQHSSFSDQTAVYICQNYACQQPITQLETLKEQLSSL